jgi:hypothetical protein
MVEDVSVKAATPEQAIEWAQLMNAIPAHTNPLNDRDGHFAELGDVGETHYLAGTMGGDAQRAFHVDLGDKIVLPMINAWEWVLGDYGNLQDAARGWFEFLNPQEAHLKIDLNNDSRNEFDFNFNLKDSIYFPDLHIEEGARRFYVESGKDSEFYNPANDINGIKTGYYDAYSTGYFAQIENLPKGTHKVEFGGTFDPEGYDPIQISVTDTVTVVDPTLDYPV